MSLTEWGDWVPTGETPFEDFFGGAYTKLGPWRSLTPPDTIGDMAYADPSDTGAFGHIGTDPPGWVNTNFRPPIVTAGPFPWPMVGQVRFSGSRIGTVLAAIDLAGWRDSVAATIAAFEPDLPEDPHPPSHATPTGDFQFDGYPVNTYPAPVTADYGYRVDFGGDPGVFWAYMVTPDTPAGPYPDQWTQIADDDAATLNIRALDGTTITDVLTIGSSDPTTIVTPSFLAGLSLIDQRFVDRSAVPSSIPSPFITDSVGDNLLFRRDFGPLDPIVVSASVAGASLPDQVGFAFSTPAIEASAWLAQPAGSNVGWWGSSFDPRVTAEALLTWPQVRYKYSLSVQPPVRQFPRDDFLGGAPRQGDESRSMQATARQGVNSTYQ